MAGASAFRPEGDPAGCPGHSPQRLLRAVVVLGPDATLSNLSILTKCSPAEAEAYAADLRSRGVLHGDTLLRIADPETATATEAGLSEQEADLLHQRAALLLFESNAPTGQVAAHLVRTTPPSGEEWVPNVLERAAREEGERGDQRARIAILRRLASERLPADHLRAVLHELAKAEAHADPPQAIARYRELIAITEDDGQRAKFRLSLARCLSNLSEFDDALEQTALAAETATSLSDRFRAGVLFVATARGSLENRPRGREWLQRLQREAAETDLAEVDANIQVEMAYEACLAAEPNDVVLPLVRATLGGDGLEGVFALEPLSLHVAVLTLIWCGELRDADRVGRMVLARSTRRGESVLVALANHWLMQVALRRSRFAETVDYANAVLEIAANRVTPLVPATRGFRALALAVLGDLGAATEGLVLPEGQDRVSGFAHFHGYLHAAARVALLQGDAQRSYQLSMRLGTLASSMGTINPGVLPWRSIAALALAELGDNETGSVLAEEAVALARRFGAAAPLAFALRASAANRSEPDVRLTLLDEAVRLYEQTPNLFEHAQCLQDAARVLSDLQRIDEARRALDDADALVHEIEAPSLSRELERDRHGLDRPTNGRQESRSTQKSDARDLVRVLGEFSVVDPDGHDVTPGGVPGKAVRILVAAGGRLHMEELGDRLWDDPIPTQQVKTRLRNVLSRARGSTGPLIVRSGELVELREDLVIDAARFEEAAARAMECRDEGSLESGLVAVALYRGDLFPTDLYADWAVVPRERLRRRFLGLVDYCAEHAVERGALDVAIDLLESGIRHEPQEEDRYFQAADLCERAHRHAEARALWQRGTQLRESLGFSAQP